MVRVGAIQGGIPLRKAELDPKVLAARKAESKRQVYTFFDELKVGDSILISGSKESLKAFRSTLRTRNARYKDYWGPDAPQFDWDYETYKSIRVWRVK